LARLSRVRVFLFQAAASKGRLGRASGALVPSHPPGAAPPADPAREGADRPLLQAVRFRSLTPRGDDLRSLSRARLDEPRALRARPGWQCARARLGVSGSLADGRYRGRIPAPAPPPAEDALGCARSQTLAIIDPVAAGPDRPANS